MDLLNRRVFLKSIGASFVIAHPFLSLVAMGEEKSNHKDSIKSKAMPFDMPTIGAFDLELLKKIKVRVQKDEEVMPALDRLRSEAESIKGEGPFSVMQKTKMPPSGDKHDYMSQGRYWWPDPSKPDGLPYIRKDGEANPESESDAFDFAARGKMCSNTATLVLAWYFTDGHSYADAAINQLRTWFLDEETKMNPHLKYGQGIPGKNEGRYQGVSEGRYMGIIDTVIFVNVAAVLPLLDSCDKWSEKDRAGMKDWFNRYLDWLLQSEFGQQEGKTKNNHGTWYDAQVASFAYFLGRKEDIRKILETAKERIDLQIEADGRQPHELERTKSFTYSIFNLTAFFTLARIAETVGTDLWNYTSPKKGSILIALKYLVPYLDPKNEWTMKQIHPPTGDASLYSLVWQGRAIYPQESFEKYLDLEPEMKTQRSRLLF
jgi:hypothetical protein